MTTIKLKELMGTLRTFEMTLVSKDHPSKKDNNLALKNGSRIAEKEHEEDDKDLNESMDLITRYLARVVKKINMKPSKGFYSKPLEVFLNEEVQTIILIVGVNNRVMGVQ